MSAFAFILVSALSGQTPYSSEIITYKKQIYEISLKEMPIVDLQNNRLKLQASAAEDLTDMIAAAARDGVFIKVNYGFRDHELQKQIFKRNRRYAAKPGNSKHETGLAIDINGIKKDKNLRRWLKQNAARFGWRQTVKKERWHFEYQKQDMRQCKLTQSNV